MAEIQQFNLGQLLGQAEAIKGARRQNQLAEMLQPLQMEEARLGLQQARLGQTQQLARGALAILGDNPQANWGQAIEFVRSRGGDVTGIEQYSPENYALAEQLASGGGQSRRIQSTYIDDQGQRVAIYTDGGTEILGRAGTPGRIVDGALVDPVTGRAREIGGQSDLTQQDIDARRRQRQEEDLAFETRLAGARKQATIEAEKIVGQQGQLNKLEDFDTAYNQLKNADLDVIYGKGEAWVPEYLRSQKGIDLIARRNQVVGMLKLGARGELKGQGPITEGEQAILGQAITVLENPNISPNLASQALDEARAVLYRSAGAQMPSQRGATTAPAPTAPQGGSQRMRFNPATGRLEPSQ